LLINKKPGKKPVSKKVQYEEGNRGYLSNNTRGGKGGKNPSARSYVRSGKRGSFISCVKVPRTCFKGEGERTTTGRIKGKKVRGLKKRWRAGECDGRSLRFRGRTKGKGRKVVKMCRGGRERERREWPELSLHVGRRTSAELQSILSSYAGELDVYSAKKGKK